MGLYLGTLVSYALLGRLFMFLLRRFPPALALSERLGLEELLACDLCLGVWVYGGLAFLFSMNALAPCYVPIVSEFVSGAAMSFGMWLFVMGWNDQFREIHVA